MSKTIALVDDDRNILTSISMALEREGFKVQTYIDGESALVGLSRNPPDLAVVDIKMPRMDGEELLRKIKKKMEERLVSEQAPPAEMKKEKPDRIPLPEDLNKEKKQIVKKNKILKKLKSRLGKFLNLKKRSFLILIK